MDMKAMIAAALTWISANSEYKDIPPPRFWMELQPSQMQDYARSRGLGYDIDALYECNSQTVSVRNDLDLRDVGHAAILVHELVHHAQCINDRLGDPCAAEREAHALQAKFIRAAGKGAPKAEELATSIEADGESACERLRRQ